MSVGAGHYGSKDPNQSAVSTWLGLSSPIKFMTLFLSIFDRFQKSHFWKFVTKLSENWISKNFCGCGACFENWFFFFRISYPVWICIVHVLSFLLRRSSSNFKKNYLFFGVYGNLKIKIFIWEQVFGTMFFLCGNLKAPKNKFWIEAASIIGAVMVYHFLAVWANICLIYDVSRFDHT